MSDWGGRVLSILSPWHMLGVLPAFGYLGEVVGGRWCKLRLHPFRLPAAAKGEASCAAYFIGGRVLPHLGVPYYFTLLDMKGCFHPRQRFLSFPYDMSF